MGTVEFFQLGALRHVHLLDLGVARAAQVQIIQFRLFAQVEIFVGQSVQLQVQMLQLGATREVEATQVSVGVAGIHITNVGVVRQVESGQFHARHVEML